MLLTFTEIDTGKPIAINPEHVALVFVATPEGKEERTLINMLNGNVAVAEAYLDVVGAIQGAK
jgi:hypothetical protein